MKRFVLMMTLLVLTLVFARAVQGAAAIAVEEDSDGEGPPTERAAFFDHGHRLAASPSSVTREPDSDAPRRRPEGIRFRYRDRGYQAVLLGGDVVGDDPVALRYDAGIDRWETTVDLPPGRHSYWFVVVDDRGRRRVRTDPANPRRRRDADHGWVSELRIEEDGEVRLESRWKSEERRRRRDDVGDVELLSDIGASYQRVDGLMLSLGPRFEGEDTWSPVLEGRLGYGFSSERWSVRATFLQPLVRDGSLRLALSAYDRSDYTDRTGVGDVENSLATLMFREDSRDWYRREGLSVGLEAELGRWLLARAEMRSEVHSSLERQVIAGWGGREDFLPNPRVDEGLVRSLFLRLRLGTDLDHLWIEVEHADDALLPSEFEFTRLTAQYRNRLVLGRDQHLDVRLRFGRGLDGTLPRQKRYLAGGIGTVRGYAYQSLLVAPDGSRGDRYGGDRLLLANAEYVVGRRSDIALAVFVDSGNVWSDADAALDLGELRSSVGIGILLEGDEEHGLRLDIARPLEGGGDPIVQGRLRRPF